MQKDLSNVPLPKLRQMKDIRIEEIARIGDKNINDTHVILLLSLKTNVALIDEYIYERIEENRKSK